MAILKKLLFLMLSFVIVGLIVACEQENIIDIEKIEYREDIEPLSTRFPKLGEIEHCYWKAAIFSNVGIGPTSYWMKGFLVLSTSKIKELVDTFDWESKELIFPLGIDPSVTGLSDFDWRYSKGFSREIKGALFVGDFYVDANHGVVYFDLENN